METPEPSADTDAHERRETHDFFPGRDVPPGVKVPPRVVGKGARARAHPPPRDGVVAVVVVVVCVVGVAVGFRRRVRAFPQGGQEAVVVGEGPEDPGQKIHRVGGMVVAGVVRNPVGPHVPRHDGPPGPGELLPEPRERVGAAEPPEGDRHGVGLSSSSPLSSSPEKGLPRRNVPGGEDAVACWRWMDGGLDWIGLDG